MNTILVNSDEIRESTGIEDDGLLCEYVEDEFIFKDFKFKDSGLFTPVYKVHLEEGLHVFWFDLYAHIVQGRTSKTTVYVAQDMDDDEKGYVFYLDEETKWEWFRDLLLYDYGNAGHLRPEFEAVFKAMEHPEKLSKEIKKSLYPMVDATVRSHIQNIVLDCHYIMDKARNREIIEREASERSGSTEKKPRKPREIKDEILTIDEVVVYTSKRMRATRHNKIHCECWGVRGHYRHYKSGKVVFIPAFEKGPKRGTVKPDDRHYILKKA